MKQEKASTIKVGVNLQFIKKYNNMNELITKILEKHVSTAFIGNGSFATGINNAIIEICEEQKFQCAKIMYVNDNKKRILKTKNIAE